MITHSMFKTVAVILAVLIFLGLAFWAGSSYENEQKNLNTNEFKNESSSVYDSQKEKENIKVSNKNVLDLSNQNLTKVPDYVFSRTEISELDLSGNKLEGALQAEVRHLQNLVVLNLSNNNFTGVPAEVGQLKKLETLNLANNSLTGLPYELGNLSNLKLLDLSGNNYSQIDLDIIKKSLPKTAIIKTN